MTAKRTSLVIVGGGPSCTYVLERLAARVASTGDPFELDIHIFERTGEFGAGQVHSSLQPKSSFLNRIAGQVAFAADETVENAGWLLPRSERMPLDEWCRAEYARTGEEDFNLQPEDWPKRYVHGRALIHNFEHFCRLLEAHQGVRIERHHDEVVDLLEQGGRLQVVSLGGSSPLSADHVMFLTGHSSNDPFLSLAVRERAEFADRSPATYVASAYPLEHNVPLAEITPETVVACDGSGLTTLDVILYLTEGQGGAFVDLGGGRLCYEPTGREPARIIPVSHSGLLTFARPFNAKEVDLDRFEHRGVFFTHATVDRLRASYGVERDLGRLGVRKQLDFERTLWPVMVLEMAFLSYRTLLGDSFGDVAQNHVLPSFVGFLEGGASSPEIDARVRELGTPLAEFFDEVAKRIDAVLDGRLALEAAKASNLELDFESILDRFLTVVYEDALDPQDVLAELRAGRSVDDRLAGVESPFGHARQARTHRFSWEEMISPIASEDCSSPAAYQEAVLRFMRLDHLWAKQNNLMNPAKAAADGVWRDLRQTLAYAADFGGFTASSHRTFLDIYMRHHNRLANGAALEVMEKMLALIECGLLDMSIGPCAHIENEEKAGCFRVIGSITGASVFADCIIDSKVHPFDPDRDVRPLYHRLLERGWIRKWVNPGIDMDFAPGGLELTHEFHPVSAAGSVDERMTFLGPPTEGIMFFQLGALRPNQNHHVMEDILRWLNRFWKDVVLGSSEAGRAS